MSAGRGGDYAAGDLILHVLVDAGALEPADGPWASLSAAHRISRPVHVQMHVDDPVHARAAMARHPPYPHGTVRVLPRRPAPLEQNVLGMDPDMYDSGKGLHVVVTLMCTGNAQWSPKVLRYVEQAASTYLNSSTESRAATMGLSLRGIDLARHDGRLTPVPLAGRPYLYQRPQACGGVYLASEWLRFCEWLGSERGREALGPDRHRARDTVGVRMSSVWELALFYFMTQTKRALLYPDPGARGALLVAGDGVGRAPLWRAFTAEELGKHGGPFDLPPLANIPVYTGFGTVTKRLHSHDGAVIRACTMVLTVYDRYRDVINRLRFYHTLPCLRAILVVWNAVTEPVAMVQEDAMHVPVWFAPQRVNSMNNRFRRDPRIQTACIVNMDDDWNMPHSVLTYAVRLWYHSFRTQVVGVKKLGRLHGLADDGSLLYLTNASAPLSLALPSGMVYHRRYMDAYTLGAPRDARELVDELVNCDDLLFNFVVANATHRPPVFVDTSGIRNMHVIKNLGKAAGLYRRSQHFVDRHLCLNKFKEMYGGMPLSYTRSAFRVTYAVHLNLPILADLHASSSIVCRRCYGEAADVEGAGGDCVVCADAQRSA